MSPPAVVATVLNSGACTVQTKNPSEVSGLAWTPVPCVSGGPARLGRSCLQSGGLSPTLELPGRSSRLVFSREARHFFFLNCNVSGSIKNKVCVHVSCNTLTLELTAKGEDFSGFQHYYCIPGHCGISILLLWHFLIKNRTLFLVELIGFIFVSCKFCWEKVKSFT